MVFITNNEYKELLEIKFRYELEHKETEEDKEELVEEETTGFKVGDRVKDKTFGLGTIIYDDGDGFANWLVEFDNANRDLHDGRGHGKDLHCYWLDSDDLELVEGLGKFKLGDVVIGNKKANERYEITRKGWKGIVTDVRPKEFTASGFELEYEYFDLYKGEEK